MHCTTVTWTRGWVSHCDLMLLSLPLWLHCGSAEQGSGFKEICKEMQPVHPRGDQSRVFIGRTDVEAETPILWPPDGKSWLIWKDPDAGKHWRQEKKGMTEDELVGCHHWLNGHEFGKTLEVGDGQGGLAWCSPWGCRVRHNWVTELNWTEQWYTWGNEAASF